MMSPQIASSYNQLRTHSSKRIVDAKQNHQHRKSPQRPQQQRERGGKSPSSFDPSAVDTLLRKIQASDSKPHHSGGTKIKVNAKKVVSLMSAATKNFQWEKSLELIQCVMQRGDPVLDAFLGSAALSALRKGGMLKEMRVCFVYRYEECWYCP
jgi:hypothetical protein